MRQKNVSLSVVVSGVLILLLLLVIVSGGMLYVRGFQNPIAKMTSRFIPYPAAIIGGTVFVTIGQLEKNLAALRSFYENEDFSKTGFRIDFDTENGQKRLAVKQKQMLAKMIENRLVEKLASERGIFLEEETLLGATRAELEKRATEKGSFEDELRRLYGWSIMEFQENIVRPQLMRSLLEKDLRENEPSFVSARKKIDQAMATLSGGKKFEEVAKQFSEGESAKNSGDLGWFSSDQMIPQAAVAVSLLEKDSRTDVVESPLGFHIIELMDKKNEEGIQKFKIRQIFVRTEPFSDWLIRQEKSINILVVLPGLRWNRSEAKIEFSDPQLDGFEKNLEKNSEGDISVMF